MRPLLRAAVALVSLAACAAPAVRHAPSELPKPSDAAPAPSTKESATPQASDAGIAAEPKGERAAETSADVEVRNRRCAEQRASRANQPLHEIALLDGGTAGFASLPDSRPTHDPVSVSRGRLPPETIQQVVRASFDAFRTCYESGLRRDPKLHGRVATAFVIDECGDVVKVQDSHSDLPDADVVACIQQGYARLRFPPPKGGIVTVVYPISFDPGN
ncbi:AgmX/PglI C-terminal domain-containing protein [Labilithrix luteola]|nr:AgmX/PglI C-terminal domain-containing protein [Labilithrix luteola]